MLEAQMPVEAAGNAGAAITALRTAAGGAGPASQDAVVTALVAAGRERPLVLLIDDLQWAAEPLVVLLRHVLRALDRKPMLMICTYRERLPATHLLAAPFAELRKRRSLVRIALHGLNEPEVATFIEGWFGKTPHDELAHTVFDRTEGNPLFIEELLRHLAETDVIYERDGELASAVSVDEMDLPEAIEEMIVRRLAFLSDECNRVLAAGSVIGLEFDVETLERATGVTTDRLVDTLDDAIRAGVVQESLPVEDRYAFTHSLIREALYHGLTATRRARLHHQTLHYADSAGVRLAFEEIGVAGPCVVATGISSCPAVRMRSLVATRRWERISRNCRVVLYDRRGIGSSDAPERGYSLRASAEDLRAVLFAAGAAGAVVFGSTDGGPLAIEFATLYPERTLGLVLAGTSPQLINVDGWTFGISDEAMAGLGPLDEIEKSAATKRFLDVRGTVPVDVNATNEMMRRMPPHAWAKIRACLGASDVRGLLAGLRVPVLILHDPDNRYIPVGAAHYLHEHIAGSRLILTEEVAAPLYGETLYGAVETFVAECGRTPPPATER
jgi:pimeloyl-ACP methyl ester carboxylesterase